MVKKKLLLLSLLILCCSGCSNHYLFIEGKKANEEEIQEFFSQISRLYQFIPNGWYEYKSVRYYEYSYSETNLVFYCEAYIDEKGNFEYRYPKLEGYVTYGFTNAEYYISDGETTIKKTIDDSKTVTMGGKNIGFYFTNSMFGFYGTKSFYDYYLDEYLFHANYVSRFYELYSEIDIAIKYDKTFTKIIDSYRLEHVYFSNDLIQTNEHILRSCDEKEIVVPEIDYYEDFDDYSIETSGKIHMW